MCPDRFLSFQDRKCIHLNERPSDMVQVQVCVDMGVCQCERQVIGQLHMAELEAKFPLEVAITLILCKSACKGL